MARLRPPCPAVVAVSLGVLLGGACSSSGDDALGEADSTRVTLGELDGVVVTVPAEDLSGEPIRIDETESAGTETPVVTIAEELADAGVEAQDVEPESNVLGGDDPEDGLMPDVVCMGLQAAQDEIQDHGVFFSKSRDATGEGRRQIWDRNWVVVEQFPAAGEPIGENEAVLSVVKTDEASDC